MTTICAKKLVGTHCVDGVNFEMKFSNETKLIDNKIKHTAMLNYHILLMLAHWKRYETYIKTRNLNQIGELVTYQKNTNSYDVNDFMRFIAAVLHMYYFEK